MRTTDDFLTAISEDLIWRRKELTELKGLVASNRGSLKERVLIRAAVALLYAHWEGFVKNAGSCYLKFVSLQRLKCADLSLNFLALAARSSVGGSADRGELLTGIALAKFYSQGLDKVARVPHKNVVNTRSNLGSGTLKDILILLGLSEDEFRTKMHFIDANLVNRRNHIAHGQALFVSFSEYEQLHADVLTLIETFRNLVENAATTRSFAVN